MDAPAPDIRALVAQMLAQQDAMKHRMDRLEATVNERNDELHSILRDLAVTTSHFSDYRTDMKTLKKDHEALEADIKQAMTVFQAGRWFLTAVIPMLVGILLMQIFKLDGMPWGS
jgi:predicted nuclease with TOPRIM domain